MSAAIAGQCGQRLLPMMSPFRTLKNLVEPTILQCDCHQELQSIWMEIGEDTRKKQDELVQAISDAVNDVYKKVLEESLKQKLELEDMVSKSEMRLKDILGHGASQVIASKGLALPVRLNVNMSRLKDLASSKFDCRSWIDGRAGLVKLLVQILNLRDILSFPACNSVDLDEVLQSTIRGLQNIFPSAFTSMQTLSSSMDEENPMFQRLQHFYRMLCSIDAALINSFDSKDRERSSFKLQDSTETIARKRSLDTFLGDTYDLLLTTSTFGSTPKRGSSNSRHRIDDNQDVVVYSDTTAILEQLCVKVARKLDDLNEHLNASNGSLKSSSLQTQALSKSFSTPSKTPSGTGGSSVLPSPKISRGLFSMTCQSSVVNGSQKQHVVDDLENVKVKKSESKEENATVKQARTDFLSTINKFEAASKESHPQGIVSGNGRCPLSQITNTQTSNIAIPIASKTVSTLTKPPQSLSGAPPPPPPPPRSGLRGAPQPKTIKLKRSSTISRLYMGMKKKVEGAVSTPLSSSDGAVQRRTPLSTGTREGMAEALAEITRRSSYFRKIEDDVQKHAQSIHDVKSQLESFATEDMEKLLKFHRSIEAQLELLTDESQVLARFPDFPVKKLETLRAAASLYARLTSLKEHIESWTVEPPISEQVEKVTAFFEKVKTDMESIERTKDEDLQRFRNQKVIFSFDIINRIKESTVHLSSRCLAAALKESRKIRSTVIGEDDYVSAKDLNKLKLTFQMLYKAFQLAFRVHNFAGGHDDRAEELSSDVAIEMETYPSSLWSDLVNK